MQDSSHFTQSVSVSKLEHARAQAGRPSPARRDQISFTYPASRLCTLMYSASDLLFFRLRSS